MKRQKHVDKLKKALERYASAKSTGNQKVMDETGQLLREESVKEHKALHRARLMDLGFYGIHKPKTHKSKKTYSRKTRNNKNNE
jgi:hypothetical protein